MTEFNREIPIVIDVDNPSVDSCVFGHAGYGVPTAMRTAEWRWMLHDYLTLRVFFWSSTEGVNLKLASGLSLAHAGCKVPGDGYMFSGEDFEEVNVGTEEAPIWAYDMPVNLADSRLVQEMSELSTMLVEVDIEAHLVGGLQPRSARFRVKIIKDSYNGADPGVTVPPYPPASDVVLKLRGSVELDQGISQLAVPLSGLAEAPAQVLLSLRVPSAEAPLIPCAVAGTPAIDGFIVVFSADIPAEGYILDYLLIT